MKIILWNVNGLRAIAKKNFFTFLENENPDILAIQEIKCRQSDLSENLLNLKNYHAYFNSADKSGYSGVAIYTKEKPVFVKNGFGTAKFDTEGRVIEAHFKDFILLNIYFPNGKMSPQRLNFKMDFYYFTIEYAKKLIDEKKNIIIVGDYNTAHQEIDLARPKENETVSGFLKSERILFDNLIQIGMLDVFRHFNKEPGNYTWWSVRTRARERNVGWRIDYALTNKDFLGKIKSCKHLSEVKGSDHCPVELELI